MNKLPTLALYAVIGLLAAQAAMAQRTNQHEVLYRCKDASGQTHYGDSLPQGCADRDTQVLNARGDVLRVIESESSRKVSAERQAREQQEQLKRDQQRQRDRVLLSTYLSVQDIERLRDQRLELLTAQVKVTEQNITTLNERSRRLESQLNRYRPYSSRADAPPVPEQLAAEMINIVNNLQVHQQALQQNQDEQAQLRDSFEADIQRFRELKGLR